MEPDRSLKRRTDVHSRPTRVAGATAALVAAATAIAVAGPSPSAAQESGEGSGIQVEADAGFAGRYLIGRRLPVVVDVEADRLVRGAVEVSVDGHGDSYSVPLEVPGGSGKRVVVVVPTPSSFPIGDVQVRVIGGGDPVTVEISTESLDRDQLVGLLPGVTPADLPAPLALPADIGTAHFVAITEELLASPGALDPLGSLVAAPDEVSRLDAASRRNVLDWADRGGRLIVDATAGPVAGLPDEWQPGDTGRARAGLGSVRLSGGRAAAGDWAAVVEPTPTISLSEVQRLGIGVFSSPFDLVTELGRDAGLESLDLPWLLAFLGAYVVLTGPVAWLVLRRRRPSLGWLTIPVTAAVFTALCFVVGNDLRSGTTTTHGTVFEQSAAGTRATTVVGTISRSGGDGRAGFPEGWTASGVDVSMFGIAGAATELAISTGPSGAQAEIPLVAGGFGVVRGTGPDDDPVASLAVAASTNADGSITGTVTNTGSIAVERIGLYLGRAGERLDALDPGASATFEFSGDEFGFGDPWSPTEAQLWPNESGWNGFDGRALRDSPVNIALLNDVFSAVGPNAHPRGIVTAVGWTREARPGVEISGGRPQGRSAVVARAAVQGLAGQIARGAAVREILRGPDSVDLPDSDLGGGLEGMVWGFTLPVGTGITTAPLQMSIPGFVARVDVWDGTAWQVVDETAVNPALGPGATRVVAMPTGGLLGDTVLVRGFISVDFGGGADGIDIFTGEAT